MKNKTKAMGPITKPMKYELESPDPATLVYSYVFSYSDCKFLVLATARVRKKRKMILQFF
jgi:hypothetical protein